MKCTCYGSGGAEGLDDMKVVAGYDDPKTVKAFNVHFCKYCGSIYKDNIWKDKSIFCLDIDNKLSRVK